MLTAKQEKFCQGVAKGLNYSDAYREAYNAGKMKPESVNRLATRAERPGSQICDVKKIYTISKRC